MPSAATHLDSFAAEARTFCRWATGEDGAEMSVVATLRRVSSLYAAALELPPPYTEGVCMELLEVALPAGEVALVTARAARLPFQVYWETFDPLESPPVEPVAGCIVDDLGGIFGDVARGLALFESGHRTQALWEWAFNFRIHWGRHATAAVRALHAHLVQE
jgi:hypothetical protein